LNGKQENFTTKPPTQNSPHNTLTDLEFDLLDELYFVQPYQVIKEHLGWSDPVIQQTLKSLLDKNWIKCFLSNSDEILSKELIDLENKFKNYYYLATKAGLLAHNSK
jgi:hypothetical protein